MLTQKAWTYARYDVAQFELRVWPMMPFLSTDEHKALIERNVSTNPLKLNDPDLRLTHRLLYFARNDLWLTEEDKDWR